MKNINSRYIGAAILALVLPIFIFCGNAQAKKVYTKTVDGIKVSFSTDPSPPKAGNNIFRISLKDKKDNPIENAVVMVKWMMPEMPDMGTMKDTAVITKSKDYAVAAELGMGGGWKVTVIATMPDKKVIETDFEFAIK